ncbi:hypothetical protein FACS189440_15990 [Bacteroidia bacterium]|nr:hypothetical protein FACS189440_15990 [Bacteroidia bacterium]
MAQLTIDFEPAGNDGGGDYCRDAINRVSTMMPTGEISVEDIFQAYYDCRKNKRNTSNSLKFELNYEQNLLQLRDEINAGTYRIGRSVAFIVNKPVKREIFAAGFRDRVVHHLLINKMDPLFEKEFIYDSYSCRKGKGTLFGVKRVSRFIRACSKNYTKDCYILKIDIQGFFMNVRRDLLCKMLHQLLVSNYHGSDKNLLLGLMEQIVMNDCVDGCYVKCPLEEWEGLPANKSLFKNDFNRGLPIGNLTSQLFANYYLTFFDHFIKSTLGMKYYARYVDDCVFVHEDKEYLKNLLPQIRAFLDEELGLTLHPKKITLQHYTKGIKFVGAYILPNRIYVDKRTKGNFYAVIEKANQRVGTDKKPLTNEEKDHLLASVNSYLGFMRHYKTYKLRKRMLYRMSAKLEKYVRPAKQYTKLKRVDK